MVRWMKPYHRNTATFTHAPTTHISLGAFQVYRTIARKNVPVIAHILTDAGHGHDGESGYSDEYK